MTFPVLPAALDGMQSAIKAWADAQIGPSGALSSLMVGPYTTIWSDQDAPYPGDPYAVLTLLNPPGTVGGMPDMTLVDNMGMSPDVSRREFDYEMVFRIELFSRAPLKSTSGVDETRILAGALQASMYTTVQLEAFQVAGLALISQKQPFAVPQVAGFGMERRTYFDTTFRARMRVDVSGPYVLVQSSAHGASNPAQGHEGGTVGG